MFLLGLVWGLGLAAPVSWAGPMYRFVDDEGIVHFTDLPVDERYQRVRVAPTGLVISPRWRESTPESDRFDPLIARYASTYRVHPGLVKAVIAAESNFNARAVSHKGAQGLMQLMPRTASRMGVENPMRPAENVKGGVRYLRKMLDRYGDVSWALAAYNAGPEAVDRYRGVPPYPETRAYVHRVLNYRDRYDDDFRR